MTLNASFTAKRFAHFLIVICVTALVSGCGWFGGDKREASEFTPKELYDRGHLAIINQSWQRAVRDFKLLTSEYPFGHYTEQAQLELAFAYFKSYEPDLAIATLNRFIKTYPTHEHIDYAHYLKGLVNFERDRGLIEVLSAQRMSERDQQNARQAFLDFNELITKYPESRYSPDARQRMVYLREGLAQYELSVAKYYMRRQAFVAAANRARGIVEKFQRTAAAPDALAIMVEAYDRLGMTDLSDDAMRVLELNHPSHPYITNRGRDGSFWDWLWPFS